MYIRAIKKVSGICWAREYKSMHKFMHGLIYCHISDMQGGENIEVLTILPINLRNELQKIIKGNLIEALEEINIRAGKPVILRLSNRNGKYDIVTEYMVSNGDIRETLGYISDFSMYAYEEEVREGFLTIRGGHRIGISGKVVMENGNIKTIKNITSLNIRIARQVKGCADEIMSAIMKEEFENTLIISPPCMGKTTLLREMVRLLSDRYKYKVGLVDERGEIAACHMGVPQNDIGLRTDVMDGCKKDKGIMMLIRSMSPDIIAIDELGGEKDVEAIYTAGNYGGRVIGTIHGKSIEVIVKKQFVDDVISNGFFKNYIVLQGDRTAKIFDGNGKCDGKVYRLYSDSTWNDSDRF